MDNDKLQRAPSDMMFSLAKSYEHGRRAVNQEQLVNAGSASAANNSAAFTDFRQSKPTNPSSTR